jgi:hypothetical protein
VATFESLGDANAGDARGGGGGRAGPRRDDEDNVLLLGMIALGLSSFAAMLAFIELCDRV